MTDLSPLTLILKTESKYSLFNIKKNDMEKELTIGESQKLVDDWIKTYGEIGRASCRERVYVLV